MSMRLVRRVAPCPSPGTPSRRAHSRCSPPAPPAPCNSAGCRSRRLLYGTCLNVGGRRVSASCVVDLHADRGVRADHRALVALDAELLIPHRNLGGDVALLPFRRAGRPRAVDRKRADRQPVALVGEHDGGDALARSRCAAAGTSGGSATLRRSRDAGTCHLVQVRRASRRPRRSCCCTTRVAALAVGLLDRVLDLARSPRRAAGRRRSRRSTSA